MLLEYQEYKGERHIESLKVLSEEIKHEYNDVFRIDYTVKAGIVSVYVWSKFSSYSIAGSFYGTLFYNDLSICLKNIREGIEQSLNLKCKDCDNNFKLDTKELNWLHKKDLKQPKRCKICRNRRKQNKRYNDKCF